MTQIPLQSLFVGREIEQQCYRDMLNNNGNGPWVLIVTAQGGNGKSALLRQFAEKTPTFAADALAVTLNFAIGSLSVDPLAILEQLVEQLAPHGNKKQFEAFQRALHEGRSILGAPQPMIENIIAGDYATVKENVQSISGASREQRRNVYELVRGVCYELVDTLRVTRLVVLLDTCERLNELEGEGLSEVGQWVMNELVPGLHSRARYKYHRCYFVLASRLRPSLEAIDAQEDVKQLALPMLEQPFVEQYLERIGMQDAALRKQVYILTHGHALCVSIIGSLWLERGAQPFTLADLPLLSERFNERALLKFIGERVLDKRLKSPYRELTRYGALLRSFNLPLLQAVFPELLSKTNPLDQLRRLIQYPYIESRGNYSYAFHDLLREIQAEEIRVQEPQKWLDYHKRALDYLTQTASHSPEWYYHALAYDEDFGMSDWWETVQDAQIRGKRAYLGALLEATHDRTLRLSKQSYANLAFWEGTFYRFGGQMQEAWDAYEQALALFRQVGDRLGEANVRKAMGDVQQFRKDMQAALQSYEQALALFRQVGSSLGEANVLQAMGDVQQFRDDREAALQSYEQALALFRQVGSSLGEANCYLAQGRIALQEQDFAKALSLQTDAYRLYQHIQDGYSQARLLYYRSFVHEAMNEIALAIKDIQQALLIAEPLNLPFIDLFRERLETLQGT